MRTMEAVSRFVISHITSMASEVVPPTHVDRIDPTVKGSCLSSMAAARCGEIRVEIAVRFDETHVAGRYWRPECVRVVCKYWLVEYKVYWKRRLEIGLDGRSADYCTGDHGYEMIVKCDSMWWWTDCNCDVNSSLCLRTLFFVPT